MCVFNQKNDAVNSDTCLRYWVLVRVTVTYAVTPLRRRLGDLSHALVCNLPELTLHVLVLCSAVLERVLTGCPLGKVC